MQLKTRHNTFFPIWNCDDVCTTGAGSSRRGSDVILFFLLPNERGKCKAVPIFQDQGCVLVGMTMQIYAPADCVWTNNQLDVNVWIPNLAVADFRYRFCSHFERQFRLDMNRPTVETTVINLQPHWITLSCQIICTLPLLVQCQYSRKAKSSTFTVRKHKALGLPPHVAPLSHHD